jgi:digeranylgeranylglycerophospholipid reductase
MAALTLARRGREVLVLERKKRIGRPVHCGEAVSESAFTESGIIPDPSWVVKEVTGSKIITPSGKEMLFPRKGFCIRRDLFDEWLIAQARSSGARVRSKTPVSRVTKEDGGWTVLSGAESFHCKILIVAAGAENRIEGLDQMRPHEPVIRGYQYKFKKVRDTTDDYLRFYHGEYFHPGYAWIFDRGEEVSVGMGGYGDVISLLKDFCTSRGFEMRDRISSHFGYIPHGYPHEAFEEDGVLWVGDAAGLVHPMTRGGIHLALHSGRVAGETIADALESADLGFLQGYEQQMGALVRSFKRLWRDSRWFYSISDQTWDGVGDLMDGKAYDSLPIAGFLGCSFREPRLAWSLVKLHGVQKRFKRTERFSW